MSVSLTVEARYIAGFFLGNSLINVRGAWAFFLSSYETQRVFTEWIEDYKKYDKLLSSRSKQAKRVLFPINLRAVKMSYGLPRPSLMR